MKFWAIYIQCFKIRYFVLSGEYVSRNMRNILSGYRRATIIVGRRLL